MFKESNFLVQRFPHTSHLYQYRLLITTDLLLPQFSATCLLFSLLSLINADFCVAGCLIAYGALLGKVSPVQLMVLTLFGITLFAVEEYIILNLIHVSQLPYEYCCLLFSFTVQIPR